MKYEGDHESRLWPDEAERSTTCRADGVLAKDRIAEIGAMVLTAPLDGVLRGLTRDCVPVTTRTKVIEVDPRGAGAESEASASDRAGSPTVYWRRFVSGSVARGGEVAELSRRATTGLHPGITQEVAPNESQRDPKPTTREALIY
jgi:hypothetical protein